MKLNFIKKKTTRRDEKKKKLTLRNKVIIALGAVLCVVAILLATTYGVFLHYYNKMNITSLDDDYEIVTKIDLEDDDINESELTPEEKKQLDELIKDAESTRKDPDQEQDPDQKQTEEKEDITVDKKITSSRNVTNILLLGTDSRAKGNKRSRTDTMVILSIDKSTKRLIMTSVMRDTYVSIPKVGKNRLNAAFVFGGPRLLFDTIEKNFGIHLDKYVQIDFYNFINMVDAVGGVDIKLSSEEIKVMNKTYLPYINKSISKSKRGKLLDPKKPGVYHLNGAQALAYSRIRYVGTDFGRTERQRTILTKIIKKAKKMSASEINHLADVVLPMVTTNLSQGEVMSLLINASDYLNYDVVSGRMPIDGSYKYLTIRGASVLGVNFADNRRYWYKLVYGKS